MQNLNHRLVLFSLFMLTLTPLESCDLGGIFGLPTVSVQLDSVFQLSIGQTAHLRAENLSITFKDVVEDSRCPVDVVCIWAGNAKVAIEAKQAGKAAQILMLNSAVEPRETLYEGFRIQFEGLMPQPHSVQPIHREDYRLSLRISR